MKTRKLYLWVDTETAGLQYSQAGKRLPGELMELSAILTDSNLNVIFEHDWTIKFKSQMAEHMDKSIYTVHKGNGLIDSCKKSKLESHDIEDKLIELLDKYTRSGDIIMLAGNSIGFDKEVIRRNCPNVFEKLYYRVLDVSSIKELLLMIRPSIVYNAQNQKKYIHRALPDIKESIDEFKVYWRACDSINLYEGAI